MVINGFRSANVAISLYNFQVTDGYSDIFIMSISVTSQLLFSALRHKFPKAAIIREVTMTDEEQEFKERSYRAARSRYYRSSYNKKGLSYGDPAPDYDPTQSVVRRIDALIFDGKLRTAVEIKISRADFKRDTLAKRSAWMRHTDRFVYLTPKGMVKNDEVPEGCGLWEYDNGVITVVKKAKVNKDVQPLPESMVKYFAWRAFIAEKKR